jgi:hypothetical protein
MPPGVSAGVRAFLEARGCDAAVIERGLDGLIADWEEVAAAIDRGYPLDTLDDYLNDMDTRQLIHDVVAAIPRAAQAVAARLAAADRRAKARLEPRGTCLWGAPLAVSRGWSPEREWWYFMQPARPGPGLSRDLGR